MTPSPESRLSHDDALTLYQSIFRDEFNAVLKSAEYKPFFIDISKEDRRKIKNNLEQISYYAARYFIERFGTNLPTDESELKNAITESLMAALIAFNP